MNRSKIVSFGVLAVLGILVVSSIMKGEPAEGGTTSSDGQGADPASASATDSSGSADETAQKTAGGPEATPGLSVGQAPTVAGEPTVKPAAPAPKRDSRPAQSSEGAVPGAAARALAAAKREIDAGNARVALPAIGAFYRKSEDVAVRDALRPKLLAWAKRYLFSPNEEHGFYQRVVIEPGDSLVRIARRIGAEHKIAIDPLFVQEVNRIRDPRRIRAGARLMVPTMAPSIVVTLSEYRLDFYLAGCLAGSYRAGIGKEETPTPVASWVVSSKLDEPDWFFDGKRIPFGDPRNELGERWIGLKHDSLTGFGIHGTNDDASIGKAASRGCVRLHNAQVVELYRRVPLGTPVVIHP